MYDGIIDLSHHNGPRAISGLETAYKSGIRAVIHKATEGTTFVDKQFRAVRDEARRLGMLFGSYHFGTASDSIEQAKHYLDIVGPSDGELLILDLEANSPNPSSSMFVVGASFFVGAIRKSTGRTTDSIGLYSRSNYLSRFPSNQNLLNCWLWLARYNATKEPVVPTGWSSWDLWQFTDKSDIPGIGLCDRSRFRGSYDDLVTFWQQHTRKG